MPFKKQPIRKNKADSSTAKIVSGKFDKYKDFKMDTKGYFLIRLNRKKKIIEAGHCSKLGNKVDIIITGRTPQEIYTEAIKRNLIGNLEHAAYLGKELEIAYIALKKGLEYEQDEELMNTKFKQEYL